MMNYLHDAISKAGGVSELAKALGVTRSAVSQWKHKTLQAPAKHCVRIEQLTGVSRHKLRPDVFGEKPPSSKSNVQRSEHRAA